MHPDLPIRIALVDDHTIFRQGMVSLFKERPSITVLFDTQDGNGLQRCLQEIGVPDVILMDIEMQGMDGHEATQWLRRYYPGVKVLALTLHEEDEHVLRMIRNGAGGYILKQSGVDEVVRGIRDVHQTGFHFNEVVSGRMVRFMQDPLNPENQVRLTPREMSFLKYCCTELTYKEIADLMGVGARTIDTYRDVLFDKLGLKSRVGLVLYAIRHKIESVV